MRTSQVVLSGLLVCLGMGGCIPASRPTPHMNADNLVIKVGQSTTVQITVRNQDIASGIPESDYSIEGFFYSPNSNAPQLPNSGQQPAPYVPQRNGVSDGFVAESSPELFPIDAKVEIISPATPASNVPPRIKVVQGMSTSQVLLEIKGKSPGKVIISGGFVWYAVQFPQIFLRTPTDLDPKVVIEIVP